MGLLSWDKPKKVRSSEAHAHAHQADGAPPGVYVPNMSSSDRAKWKAKLVGTKAPPLRVEIRKTTSNGTQMLLIVSEGGFGPETNEWAARHSPIRGAKYNVHISCNGPAWFTFAEFQELQAVVEEAKTALAEHG